MTFEGRIFTMNNIQNLWQYISNLGAQYYASESEIRRVRITNQLCLVAFFCYLVFDSAFLIFSIPVFQFDYFLTGFLFPIVFYLNSTNRATGAKLLLCGILFIGIFNLIFYYGKTFETNLLLFPVMQVPFFLFGRKQRKYFLLTIFLPFLIFIYLNISGIATKSDFSISPDNIKIMKNLVQTFAIFMFFLVIYMFTRLSQKSEQTLASENNLLQEQVQTIFENSSDALLVIDTDLNVISNVNQYAVELLEGEKKEDIIGKQVPDFHKEKLNTEQLVEIRRSLLINQFWSGEIEFETLKGKTFWADLTVKRIETQHKPYQLVRISDITQRKKYEVEMKSSLREKEILIDEIHHRVKNNLAIISGLLHLQSSQIDDKKLLEIFDESRRRIHSMALIHEKLYHTESFEKIDFSEYVSSLIDYIQSSYNTSATSITVNTSIKNVHLDLKHAVPCALILNELISNSYKHAFNGKAKGIIEIDIFKSGPTLSMTISDDGIGIDTSSDLAQSNSLGLTLVHSLVNQIDGTLNMNSKAGTTFQLTFNT